MQAATKSSRSSTTTSPDRRQAANIYMRMPLERVRTDALHGVRLAREAWRLLDPDGADKVLGRVIEPIHAEPSKPRRGTTAGQKIVKR